MDFEQIFNLLRADRTLILALATTFVSMTIANADPVPGANVSIPKGHYLFCSCGIESDTPPISTTLFPLRYLNQSEQDYLTADYSIIDRLQAPYQYFIERYNLASEAEAARSALDYQAAVIKALIEGKTAPQKESFPSCSGAALSPFVSWEAISLEELNSEIALFGRDSTVFRTKRSPSYGYARWKIVNTPFTQIHRTGNWQWCTVLKFETDTTVLEYLGGEGRPKEIGSSDEIVPERWKKLTWPIDEGDPTEDFNDLNVDG